MGWLLSKKKKINNNSFSSIMMAQNFELFFFNFVLFCRNVHITSFVALLFWYSTLLSSCSSVMLCHNSFSVLSPSPKKEVYHHRALLVMESLISSPDNFCPSDIHAPPVVSRCMSKYMSTLSSRTVEGQFDDVSPGE